MVAGKLAAKGLVVGVGSSQVGVGLPGEEADVMAQAIALFSKVHVSHDV